MYSNACMFRGWCNRVIWQFVITCWSTKANSSHLARWDLTKASLCFQNGSKDRQTSFTAGARRKTKVVIKSVIKKRRGRGGEKSHKVNFYSRWSGSLQGFPFFRGWQVHPCCWPSLTAPNMASGKPWRLWAFLPLPDCKTVATGTASKDAIPKESSPSENPYL